MSANTQTMFSAREMPWHGQGVNVPNEVDSEEALRLSGLDWEVELQPMFVKRENSYVDVSSAFVIVRKDNDAVLGVTGSRYKPVQNKEVFRILDSVVGEGLLSFHTAGALGNGEKVWALCRLPGNIGTEIDKIEKFILVSNSHDGSKTLSVLITPIRVVCQNTLNFALSHKESNLFKSYKHTLNVSSKAIVGARELIDLAEKGFESFEHLRKDLSSRPFSNTQMVQTILTLLKPKDIHKVEDLSPRTIRTWKTIYTCWENGRGANLEGVKDTAWGAVNAFTEYADWYQPVRDVAGSVLFGSGARLKSEALEKVLSISNSSELKSTEFDDIFFSYN